MIRQAEHLAQLLPYDDDAFGCLVVSGAQAYGLKTAAVRFWAGEGFAVRLQDGTVTLCGKVLPQAAEELRAFLPCVGMHTLVCSASNARCLALQTAGTGVEMRLTGKIPAPQIPLRFAEQVPCETALPLSGMHRLLAACETPGFVPPPFEPFYLDLSHRIRHGAALAAGAYKGETLCACAAAALSPRQLLLFSGAALPQVRGTGIFAAVLAGLVERAAQGRTVSLLCGEALCAHYEKLGFTIWKRGNGENDNGEN
ncbi:MULTISPECIES: hypothetical protein [Caproicibacterium]|uniref:N-acetyltransferase domain-containing protein n=1 Tax=Caproicibacterium argilliputei TaxID=3030016 RepID=A0AA97D7S3_9FIRM|nr:hypothetical protein [Caproicibacterium argilliputei]WOC32135.1 hypothetical protein PXC00_13230 [Caproicibacterium argilliputei]